MSTTETFKRNITEFKGHDNLGFDSKTENKNKIPTNGSTENPNIPSEFIDKGSENLGKKKKKEKHETVPYFRLFRFATKFEIFLLVIGLICATIGSLGVPYNVVIFGEFTAILVDRAMAYGTSSPTLILSWFGGGRVITNATEQDRFDAIMEDSVAFGIGCGVGAIFQLIFCALSVDILNHIALKSIGRIRIKFLDSVLRQDMSWYDTNTSDNFAVRITDDLDKLKDGIGEKLAICINLIMAFVTSVIFAFFYGWLLTLVMLSCAPIIVLSTAFVAKIQSSLTEKELKSYSKAGSVAEEVLGGIRTVAAFSGEEKEMIRYRQNLQPAEDNGKKKGLFSGIGGGIMWFIIYCIYALAFWYGIVLILENRPLENKEYTPAVLIIILFGVLEGAQNLGLTSPLLEAFATAKGSAYSIFRLIDRIPAIDALSEKGLRPKDIEGNIRFTNVTFRYPARPDVQVLNGLSLELKAGQTTAFVGPSGCGKSTCLQLIQRMYDPLGGTVEIDGIKIPDFNIQHLRSFIGVVGQEPVLFATSIRENIRYGNPECSDEDIEKAARIANCHRFISKLPDGYDTLIGERGSQLSGGQKQRIAIARAVVRNPRILILDEATSALDPTSEKRVQVALERASKGRTTVVVSHRLSTIFNADKIVVVKDGVVAEEGTHLELIAKKGKYYELVNANRATLETDSPKPHRRRHSQGHAKVKRIESTHSQSSSESESESESDSDIEEEKKVKEKIKVSNYRLMKMNAPEWPYILMGCIGAITVGASFPTYAVLFGEMYGILSSTDTEWIQNRANFYSILFLGLGFLTGIAAFVQTYMFTIAGVLLTSRLRSLTFKAMIHQEIGWFDEAKNGVGALCSRLSSDCAAVQGATGSKVGSMLQAGSVIFIGIGISLFYSWKMTLVASVFIPPIFICVYLESVYMESSNIKERAVLENATKMAVEAISNIRTVNSLNQEIHVLNRYVVEMRKAENYSRKKSLLRGLIFGLGKSIPNFGYAVALWYGGTLIAHKEVKYEDVIKVGEALIWGSLLLGQALAFAPNVNAAILSASRILQLLDRKPNMKDGKKLSPEEYNKANGNVMYQNVEFSYPTRPDIIVLDEFSLDIKKGQTIALVGSSGCGKSTCMQLLLRYYDPDEGQVNLDGVSSIDFPMGKIRSHLGLVSQEPVLFDRTIAENIAYGDNSREVPMNEIIEAAKAANIHEFVTNLPLQYDTGLGNKGAQLSGGQKQRVAIARALVRNPKILLLDEATSALDTHSEKVVQAALDKARTGRTCIMIAHRLTTIHNADLICVVENGQVVEKGTHEELMKLGAKYAKLYAMQQVD